MRGERGSALLVTLGALALVGALAASALVLVAGPSSRAAAALAQAEAMRAAEGAAHRLIAAASSEALRGAAPLDGTVISTDFLGARIDFAAQDAGGLIDLNAAPEPALARLLAATGASEAEAEEIAALWAAARAEAGPRGGWAEAEAAVEALPERLQAAARPALAHATVRNGRPGVDPWTATAPALAAAGALDLGEAQDFVARRALEGRRAAPPEPRAPGAWLASEARSARLTVRAEGARGGRAEVVVELRLSTSPIAPVTILSWR